MVIVCGGDGSNTQPMRKKTIFCGARSCVEYIPEKRHEWIESRKGGTAGGRVSPSWHQILQVPWIHHICPQRNMLVLFRSLKKSDASVTVLPVTFCFFLLG